MQRRLALTLAGAALLGGAVLAPSATADPSACLTADIEVNGMPIVDDTMCLPPEDGGGAPALPGVPELPGVPDAPELSLR